jgi:ubiquinone/menaquinone biosynthesis C-methylase UbiE
MRNNSTQAAFDDYAPVYDDGFTNTVTGRLQRKRVHALLLPFILQYPALKILEINCGTGEDAIWMAGYGHHVTGVDLSENMINVAAEKVKKRDLNLQLSFNAVAFDKLKEHFAPESFDLIFSNFGGLNCISPDEFNILSFDLVSLLKPGGKFAGVVMGRKCIWEILYFFLKGDINKAFRRMKKGPVQAVISEKIIPVWYFSPSMIKDFFRTKLLYIHQQPAGLFLPPSYLEAFFKERPGYLDILHKAESYFEFNFLADFADHYFILFEKSNTGTGK